MPKDKSLKRKRNRGQSIISVILGFEESLRKVSSSGERIIHGILNALWKICSLVVNGQSFLVIDGYLLNLYC